jgi:hypothetical protein
MHHLKEMLPHHKEEHKPATTTHTTEKKEVKTTTPKSIEPTKVHEKKTEVKHEHLTEEHKKHKLSTDEKYVHTHGNEKHVIHEASHLKEGEYYKAGRDPALDREIECIARHDDGTVREQLAEAPIVKESIKEVELHKVQPIIHREREQKEIRHVVEPHKEFKVRETEIHHQDRDINLGVRHEHSTLESKRAAGHAPSIEASREFLGKECQHQDLPVKIDEHVHRKVETHVHPVIYKEVLKPKVTEETHHIYEKVKESPIETYEVRSVERETGEGLREAEREFFAKESHRGMVLAHDHVCERETTHVHGHEHVHVHKQEYHSPKKTRKLSPKLHKEHKKKTIKEVECCCPTTSVCEVHQHHAPVPAEPIMTHHQNIGGHHFPATATNESVSHTTSYDAALKHGEKKFEKSTTKSTSHNVV